MAKISESERELVLELLAQGIGRDAIASEAGVTPRQVAAISAHVTMGTYELPSAQGTLREGPASQSSVSDLMVSLDHAAAPGGAAGTVEPLAVGQALQSEEVLSWGIDPAGGSANPHMLVLGESGFGKTYATSCLIAELAREGIPSVVLDYAQGFSLENADSAFIEHAAPREVQASQDGININPLEIFESDTLGPVNVAQRVADTFRRVYPQIGVQQHALLRKAVLEVFADRGISADRRETWQGEQPDFRQVDQKLQDYAKDRENPQRRLAANLASHISTIFVFNVFRQDGEKISWGDVLEGGGRCHIVQLRGLEHSVERAVTEFLMWSLIGYIESMGPGPLRCLVVLDEAHKLSFAANSPSEKLLREGRKFGLGLLLASQQPEDFSPVAFANTATKLIFQIGDEQSRVARLLHRKSKNSLSLADLSAVITKLPRGCAYFVSGNLGNVIRIFNYEERSERWRAR